MMLKFCVYGTYSVIFNVLMLQSCDIIESQVLNT